MPGVPWGTDLLARLMNSDVDAFRDEYRREHIGPGYSGGVHLVFTTCGALLGIGVALALVQDLQRVELWTIPAAFVFANLVEHQAHRWLMHVPRGPLKFLHKRHALQHHRFFAGGDLAARTSKDWKAVLFPAPVIFFFLGGIDLPAGLLLGATISWNVGALFAATGAAYYLLYEWCHLLWHQPPESPFGRLRVVRWMRAHHLAHHVNDSRGFNVTLPLMDWTLGPRLKPRDRLQP